MSIRIRDLDVPEADLVEYFLDEFLPNFTEILVAKCKECVNPEIHVEYRYKQVARKLRSLARTGLLPRVNLSFRTVSQDFKLPQILKLAKLFNSASLRLGHDYTEETPIKIPKKGGLFGNLETLYISELSFSASPCIDVENGKIPSNLLSMLLNCPNKITNLSIGEIEGESSLLLRNLKLLSENIKRTSISKILLRGTLWYGDYSSIAKLIESGQITTLKFRVKLGYLNIVSMYPLQFYNAFLSSTCIVQDLSFSILDFRYTPVPASDMAKLFLKSGHLKSLSIYSCIGLEQSEFEEFVLPLATQLTGELVLGGLPFKLFESSKIASELESEINGLNPLKFKPKRLQLFFDNSVSSAESFSDTLRLYKQSLVYNTRIKFSAYLQYSDSVGILGLRGAEAFEVLRNYWSKTPIMHLFAKSVYAFGQIPPELVRIIVEMLDLTSVFRSLPKIKHG